MQGACPNTMISVRGIRKAFGQNVVLKGIDLDVRAGEVLALIGGNGARKIDAHEDRHGIYQQDDGDIYVGGSPSSWGGRRLRWHRAFTSCRRSRCSFPTCP